jgi:predicted DsbA family dithiol-disulfide isomerase
MRDSESGYAACGEKARPQVPCSAPGAEEEPLCDLAGNVFEFLKNTGQQETSAQIVGGAFDSVGKHMKLPGSDDSTEEFRVPLEESAYYNVGFRCVRQRGSSPRATSSSRRRQPHDPSVSPRLGPATAPHNVTVFSDFQCPYCGKIAPTLSELVRIARGKVSVTFKHYPLGFHREAKQAAIASYCAHEQGKFWEFHDVLFENAKALKTSDLETYAERIGLDLGQFRPCLLSAGARGTVDSDIEEARRKEVSGVPTIFINDAKYNGARSAESLLKHIEAGDLRARPAANLY